MYTTVSRIDCIAKPLHDHSPIFVIVTVTIIAPAFAFVTAIWNFRPFPAEYVFTAIFP
jgi:hypothetical protein